MISQMSWTHHTPRRGQGRTAHSKEQRQWQTKAGLAHAADHVVLERGDVLHSACILTPGTLAQDSS